MLPRIDLRLNSVGIGNYPPGATYGPRVLKDEEFIWMIQGDAVYHSAGETLRVPQGSVLLCRPGKDSFTWDARRATRHGYFHFTLRRRPGDWPPRERWPVVRTHGTDVLAPLFQQLIAGGGLGSSPLQALGAAYLLGLFVMGQPAAPTGPGLPEPVGRAWRFASQRLQNDARHPIALADLAEAAGVSPAYLCRCFTESLGHSPMETVRRARLELAVRLLARSNYSLKEVAHFCGFADAFHFSRCYRRAFGHPPSELRDRLADGEAMPTALGGLSFLS